MPGVGFKGFATVVPCPSCFPIRYLSIGFDREMNAAVNISSKKTDCSWIEHVPRVGPKDEAHRACQTDSYGHASPVRIRRVYCRYGSSRDVYDSTLSNWTGSKCQEPHCKPTENRLREVTELREIAPDSPHDIVGASVARKLTVELFVDFMVKSSKRTRVTSTRMRVLRFSFLIPSVASPRQIKDRLTSFECHHRKFDLNALFAILNRDSSSRRFQL